MKIVNRKQFLALPANTVFSKYMPSVFGELSIKGESLKNDFYVQDIANAIECDNSSEFVDKLDDAQANGTSVGMNFDIEGRDGLYEDTELYAVWEPVDVLGLIDRLKKCVGPIPRQDLSGLTMPIPFHA